MRKEFLKNIPLIFCGIDHIDPDRISGYEPVYGVEESDRIKSTLNLIKIKNRDQSILCGL